MALVPYKRNLLDDPVDRLWVKEMDNLQRRNYDPYWDLPSRSWLNYDLESHPRYWRDYAAVPRYQRWNSWMQQAEREAIEFTPKADKDNFKVCVDVRQFKPHEITVRTNTSTITVEGKHEYGRLSDDGYVSRQFTRKYTVPSTYSAIRATSDISHGLLTVKAPKKWIL